MTPVSPEQLLELLRAARNGSGLPLNAGNVTAAAKLVIDRIVEVFRDKGGELRVRLREH